MWQHHLSAALSHRASRCIPIAIRCFPDGVFYRDPQGTLAFHVLPPPTTAEVCHLLNQIVRKTADLLDVADAADDAEPGDDDARVVAHLMQEALPGLSPHGGSVIPKPRTAYQDGFTLHADTHIAQDNRALLRKLIRYSQRPPVAKQAAHLSRARAGCHPQSQKAALHRPDRVSLYPHRAAAKTVRAHSTAVSKSDSFSWHFLIQS